jgi:TolA-binding protein
MCKIRQHYVIIVGMFSILFCFPCHLFSATSFQDDASGISFQDRLFHYLSLQTDHVVEDLMSKEMQVVQMVDLINREFKSRENVVREAIAVVEGPKDSLISDYRQELELLLQLYDNLQHLERVAVYGDQIEAYDEVHNIKSILVSSLENREIYDKGIYTAERVGETIDDYTAELDTMLGIYDTLEFLRKRAVTQKNEEALSLVNEQKQKLYKVLSRWGRLGPLSEEDYIRYQLETERIHDVVKTLDTIAGERSQTNRHRISQMKKNLVDSLDRAVYDLFVVGDLQKDVSHTTSEFIKVWKNERIIDVETHLTKYKAIRYEIIKRSDQKDLQRLLTTQTRDALLNYANGLYRVSEFQFQDIIDTYEPYFGRLTAIHYYLGEALYHQQAFERAKFKFMDVASEPKPTPFHVDALVRLLQHADKYEGSAAFFSLYERIVELDSLASGELLSYSHYKAANKYFANTQYHDANRILDQISKSSRFHLPATLLKGVIYLNLDDYNSAIPVFQSLAGKESYPWTNLNVAYIRNSALLRLGMVYYQRNDFMNARHYFEQVSQGFKGFDNALIGKAWSSLRVGDYQGSIDQSYKLLRNHLASNYSYEALVLSAHCKQLLGQPESALKNYRYVIRARKMMNVAKDYHSERNRLLSQKKQLGLIEEESLETRQEILYYRIEEMQERLSRLLFRIHQKGDRGSRLIQDYQDERVDIIHHLDDLDRVIQWAEERERPEVLAKALEQRQRLLRVLQTFQGDRDVVNTTYLIDFPLAAMEANLIWQRDNFVDLYRNLDLEKRRLENSINNLSNINTAELSFSDKLDLEILNGDLNHLQTRLSKFREWLTEEVPGEPRSRLDYWSDYAGYELSKIVYNLRQDKVDQIGDYALGLQMIRDVLQARKDELESRLEEFNEEIQTLQKRWLSRKIKLEQLEKQTYFNKYYFDTSERESENWEYRLQQLIED